MKISMIGKILFCCAVTFAAVPFAAGQWVNELDGILDFECPLGEAISRVQVSWGTSSHHSAPCNHLV
jgi:hypothetical protein